MTTVQGQQLVDHLFRHEAGKMIAVLTRIFGVHNFEVVEDVVQETFLKALQAWKVNLPDNPSAWLMQSAKNKAIDIICRRQKLSFLSDELAEQLHDDVAHHIEPFFLDTEIADSQLRMIFTCCHPVLTYEDQVALTLKTVSGFGVPEIARALLSGESAISKRLYRSRELIKTEQVEFAIPSGHALKERLEPVYTVLYLLFNEGYNSSKADELIRYDLCEEAMRLCKLLSEHRVGKVPATFALLSLMCFQASRFNSRMDDGNNIILLEHQDRAVWDKELIQVGMYYLNLSSSGSYLSVYHIESAIAAEHCLAPSFGETNWKRLLSLYDLLLKEKPGPAVQLNRAVILAQLYDVPSAIDAVLDIPGIIELRERHHIYSAVLGHLYAKAGNEPEARRHLQKALQLTTSLAEIKLLNEKLGSIGK